MILLEHHKQAKREIIARFTAARRGRRRRRHGHARARHPHDADPEARGRALPPRRARRVQPRQVDVRERAARPGHPADRHHADDRVDQPRRLRGEPDRARRAATGRDASTSSPAQLKEWVTVAGGHAERGRATSSSAIRATCSQNNVVLVDTPGRQRPQRAARRGHLRLRAARRRRACSCSTPARRSRTASASSCAAACSRARAIG